MGSAAPSSTRSASSAPQGQQFQRERADRHRLVNPPEGSYTFNVASLVSNYQAVSTGVADASRTPIGRGTVTIESGQARVNPPTYLDVLNNGDGVQRGTIRVTDRAGRTTDIDLSTALTVDDVLKTINSTYSVASMPPSRETDHPHRYVRRDRHVDRE